MGKVKQVLVQVLLGVWQLPQNFLGLFVIAVLKARVEWELCPDSSVYFTEAARIGVSLGDYILVHPGCSPRTILHEKGHQVQSRWLGPLYLLVVGLPSAVFCNLWDRLFHRKWDAERRFAWYFSRWPEGPGGHWWDRFTADALGGVGRLS
jgi:hypothetical protein